MKEKKKIAVLIGLLTFAALVWYVEVREPAASSQASNESDFRKYDPLPIENPAIQWEKIERARKTEYKSNGRDLFSEIAPPPPQTVADRKKAAAAAVAVNPGPPPPPPPPSLPPNLKFFGYGTIPNGTARRAFLTDGEDIYILGEGDTLLGKFRVVRIGNANLDFEDIATGRRGSAILDEQAAPPA